MRARAFAILFILIGALAVPVLPTSSASIEELGSAGTVAELDHASVGWWTLDNGNVLVATTDGRVIAYSVLNNGTYAEVWSVDTNTTVYSANYNHVEKLLAIGTTTGACIISIDYQDELYRFPVGQSVDALTWDRDGDLWVTMRTSKNALEWDYAANTSSGVSTTAHTIGITSIISLSDGHILTSGRDKQIRIHDENGSLVQVLVDSSYPLLKLFTSSDESLLFSLTDNCRLDVHNTTSWAREQSITLCASGQGHSLHELGDRLMIGMLGGDVFSLDFNNLTKEQEFFLIGEVIGFRAADGEGVLILTSSSSKSDIHLLDTDRDNDGVVDGIDEFPDDVTQWLDSDGDGYGDNQSTNANNPDAFPSEPTQWNDTDGDGYGDNPVGNNSDAFPNNPAQQTDSDGDGWGDNRLGIDGDKFPDDGTQWADSDGDGYGDNQELGATTPDACVDQSGSSTEDRLGCQDTDGDGWSDPGNGNEAAPIGTADAFYLEPTQYGDEDGDGYGDNMDGYRGDACGTMAGTSTRAQYYNVTLDSYVTISRYGCLDEDNDGYDDLTESYRDDDCRMTDNRAEWLDEDRDCVGSNSDYNDTDPEVQTLADHCAKHIDDVDACTETTNPNDDFDNLTLIEEQGVDTMESVKEFAVIAAYLVGGIFLALVVIVGSFRLIGKARDQRKPDAQYTHQDATRELDAWESGDEFETRGGIDEQKAWGDDHIDEESEDISDEEEVLFDGVEASPEPDYSTESETTNADEVEVQETVVESTETVTEQGSEPATQQPPAEAPPVPSGGLPEGWTMEQWRWYGHQWLERQGEN